MDKTGKVYLVGAGPGDPGLMTLRARELIERCDVLVMDQLVSPAVVAWTRGTCEVLLMGKGREAAVPVSQQKIVDTLIDRAKAGQLVVRLKGGDPSVFSRGGEELEALQRERIDYEVVPGVTAALAAACVTGIPLTHRSLSSTLVFLTGHEDPTKPESRVRIRDVARIGGTVVIYMGMNNLEALTSQLVSEGTSPDTPTAVVEWAATARQRSVFGELGSVCEQVRQHGLCSPAVVIIGEVARDARDRNWFERRPLFGQRILIPRSRSQAGRLRVLLEECGAEAVEFPLIKIEQSVDQSVLTEVLAGIGSYEWIVFTSANGVRCFFDYFFRAFRDLRSLGGARLAAIGKATANELENLHLSVDLMPPTPVAESLAEALITTESLPSAQVLVVAGNRNRADLVKLLEEKGEAIVDQLVVYQNLDTDPMDHPELVDRCRDGFDAVFFTSSSIVQNYVRHRHLFEPSGGKRRPVYASLGPITSAALREAGLDPGLEAPEADLEVLVSMLIEKRAAAADV